VLGHVAHLSLPSFWLDAQPGPHSHDHALDSVVSQHFHCHGQTNLLSRTAPYVCHAQGHHVPYPSLQGQGCVPNSTSSPKPTKSTSLVKGSSGG